MDDDQTCPESVLLVLMERAFKGPTHEGVRILDWAPQLKRVLKCVRENDPMTMELRGEIKRLRTELEASDTELRIARASQAESNAEVERLRAELAEATAWRPISTAPTEGRVLLWRAHGIVPIVAKFDAIYGEFEDAFGDHVYNVTHWMPLPKAPKTGECIDAALAAKEGRDE